MTDPGESMALDAVLDEALAPLARAERWVVGQLGQSLDGRIATASGHSHYINGPGDIRRLHRLRALCDAVIVGAGTALSDDPRLTVREVEGENPVRVVLDPSGRLPETLKIFADGAAPTLRLVAEGPGSPAPGGKTGASSDAGTGSPAGRVETIPVPADAGGRMSPARVVAVLRERGLERILVEGGGRTVSTFLEAGLLDRLHVSVAALIIGSGRPGITLPEVDTLDEALRPRVRHYALGTDLLFDVELGDVSPGLGGVSPGTGSPDDAAAGDG